MPGKYNLRDTVSGDTFDGLEFQVKTGIAPDFLPTDLTGCAIKMQIRRKSADVALKTFSVGAGISINDAVNGKFRLNPFEANLKPYTYFYDIQITFTSGVKKTYIQGFWRILAEITI